MAVLVLAAGACGEDPPRRTASPETDTSSRFPAGDGVAAPPPDTLQAVDSASQENGIGGSPSSWSAGALDAAPAASEPAVVESLRAARHDAFDRFVVEFRNGIVPGYTARYLDEQPYACGSGRPMDVPGGAVLALRFEPARGYDEAGTATVDHTERRYAFGTLAGAGISCDFEGVFSIVLGAASRTPFRVLELTDPARVIVDLRRIDP